MRLTVRVPRVQFEITIEGDNTDLIINTAIYALKLFAESIGWIQKVESA